jgi:2-polyprenyl-6-methoxyphenol hydroxylase-like FAD-dependent oxidoreductase
MSETEGSSGGSKSLHVLIAGAGVVGLTIAQGCRQRGIPFTIFEGVPDRSSRSEGWALTLHWSLRSIRRTIGPELARELPNASYSTSQINAHVQEMLILVLSGCS